MHATATPASLSVSWSRAPGGEACIDRRELVDKLQATIGHRTFAPAGDADTSIRGTVGPAPGGGWLAVIEARHPGEAVFHRRLTVDADDCRQIDEAIVLVVALMVDSSDTEAPPIAVPAAPARASVSVGVDVAVAAGMLPGPAEAFGLQSEVSVLPLWPVALWADVWPTSQALQGGAGARLGAWTAGLGLCPAAVASAGWALYGCLGASGGAIFSSGVGLDISLSHTRAYAQGELRAGVRVRVAGPLFASLELGGAVPFARDTYTYARDDGSLDVVFRTAPVIPIGRAGLEVRVP